MFKMLSKALYVLGFASIGISIYYYSQGNHSLGTFIGLWVPSMFVLSTARCPFAKN